MAKFTSAVLLLGLCILGFAVYQQMDLLVTPLVGDAINTVSAGQVGAGLFRGNYSYRSLWFQVDEKVVSYRYWYGSIYNSHCDPWCGFRIATVILPALGNIVLFLSLGGLACWQAGFIFRCNQRKQRRRRHMHLSFNRIIMGLNVPVDSAGYSGCI